MKEIIILSFLLIILQGAFQEEKDILELTTSTFQTAIETNKAILVEFYSPKCIACINFANEYSSIAKEFKKSGDDDYVHLAIIDLSIETQIGEQFQIYGYPTLMLFINGQPIQYHGDNNFGDIITWVNKQLEPSSKELESIQDLQKLLEKLYISPIIVYFGNQSDQEFEIYQQISKQFDRVVFAHTFNDKSAEFFNVKGKVAIFKSFDEKRNDFSEQITISSLQEFIQVHTEQIVLPFNQKAIINIFQQKNNAVLLFTDNSEDGLSAVEILISVAIEFKNKIKFSFIKQNDEMFNRLAEYLGANPTNLPNLIIYNQVGEDIKYKFESQMTTESVRLFLINYFDGKLSRFLKSEDIPLSNDEPVKVIVGKNFQDQIINNNKDILVLFYAPWSPHSQQLIPIYETLAIKLQVNKNIILAKCNSATNEIEGIPINSYPKIKFWKNGQKSEVIDYNESNDEASLIQFLIDNTSYQWIEMEKNDEL